MILLKLYNNELINNEELTSRMYPNLARRQSAVKLYNKINKNQGQRITPNDEALAEKVWAEFVNEINS